MQRQATTEKFSPAPSRIKLRPGTLRPKLLPNLDVQSAACQPNAMPLHLQAIQQIFMTTVLVAICSPKSPES